MKRIKIFTIPKAFSGHIGDIQYNAIRSWQLLTPRPRVCLYGDEEGVREAAQELGVECIPEIRRSEFGTPLLSDVFRSAAASADFDCLVYLNSDIMLPSGFLITLESLPMQRFVATGRRKTLDVKGRLDHAETGKLMEDDPVNARLDPPHALDYFVLYGCQQAAMLPDFSVGRPGWDNWMIYNVLRMGIPVVDLTNAFTVLHQNHDYRHVPQGRNNSWEGPEADTNRRLAGARERLRFSIADATHVALVDGSLRKNSHATARQIRLWIARHPAAKWPLEILGFPFLMADRRRRRKMKRIR